MAEMAEILTKLDIVQAEDGKYTLHIVAKSDNPNAIEDMARHLVSALKSFGVTIELLVKDPTGVLDPVRDHVSQPPITACKRCGCEAGKCRHDYCATCGGRPIATVN